MLKALIFDIDGTVADTEKYHLLAFNRAFEELGFDFQWSIDEYRVLLEICGGKERFCHYIKANPTKGFKGRDCGEYVGEVHKIKTREYLKLLSEGAIEFRSGIRELMEDAMANGIKLAIATTTSFVNVDGLFKPVFGKDWQNHFEIIGDGDKIPAKKPDSAVYDFVLRALEIRPSEALAFEDSQNGLLAAMGAKIPTIITRNDFTIYHDFKGADLVCDGLDEIPKSIGDNMPQLNAHFFNVQMARAILNQANIERGI